MQSGLDACTFTVSVISRGQFVLQISKMIYAVLANLRLVGNSKGFNISEIELK